MGTSKYLKSDKKLDEAIQGFGRAGTVQRFGKDVVISDANGRSISLTKDEVCDLLNVLKCRP